MAATSARTSGALWRWILTLVVWTSLWYSGAIACVITSKILLGHFPNHVWTLTFFQFTITLLCCRVYIGARPGSGCPEPVTKAQRRLVFGQGLSVYIGLICTNTALGMMNASLVETIKATEPVPTCILAVLVVGEGWAPRAERLALVVIVIGVMLMSYAESTFVLSGLLSTLGANLSFALANNLSKLSFARHDRLDPLNFWYRSVQIGACLAMPAAAVEVREFGLLPTLPAFGSSTGLLPLAILVFFNGFAFFLYNQATCVVIDNVALSVHAILNSARRGLLIVATTIFFGVNISLVNLMGGIVTFLGFVFFLVNKHHALAKEPLTQLPCAVKIGDSTKCHLVLQK